jgi:putative DNA primase/helicase
MSIGHSLTADTSEDSIFILYGPRDSGKTTLIESLRVVMGDYAIPINLELFTRCREANHGPTEHLASLRGVRVATSDEAEPGRELSVGVLKALSGGGSLRVRFLYGHEFNLKITHHLWLSFNDAPKISPDDDAAWKRIKTVGFDHSVPANLRDPSLRPWMELPGGGAKVLLSWAVQGCQKWIAATNGGKKHGLTLPASLMSSCTKYRNECDPLADFFKARCVFGPNEKATRAEVVSAYQEWAFEEGIKPQFRCSPRRVAEALKKRDCAEGTSSRCERTWKGISVSILNNSEAKKPATSSTSTLHITSHMCKGDIERVRGEVPVVLVEAKTQSNAEPFSFEVGI